jgi:hypothetical protein
LVDAQVRIHTHNLLPFPTVTKKYQPQQCVNFAEPEGAAQRIWQPHRRTGEFRSLVPRGRLGARQLLCHLKYKITIQAEQTRDMS